MCGDFLTGPSKPFLGSNQRIIHVGFSKPCVCLVHLLGILSLCCHLIIQHSYWMLLNIATLSSQAATWCSGHLSAESHDNWIIFPANVGNLSEDAERIGLSCDIWRTHLLRFVNDDHLSIYPEGRVLDDFPKYIPIKRSSTCLLPSANLVDYGELLWGWHPYWLIGPTGRSWLPTWRFFFENHIFIITMLTVHFGPTGCTKKGWEIWESDCRCHNLYPRTNMGSQTL